MADTPHPESPSLLAELLRDGEFAEWEAEFKQFYAEFKKRAPSAAEQLAAFEQVKLGWDHPRRIPFRYRHALWRALWRYVGKGDETKFLVLTNSDDVDSLGEFSLAEDFCGKLLAESIRFGCQYKADHLEFESMCHAITEVLLARPPAPGPINLVNAFLRELQFYAESAKDHPEIDALVTAAGPRGLQLLLTLMSYNLKTKLVTEKALQKVLTQPEAYQQLNDPSWPPEARDRALGSVPFLVELMDQHGLEDRALLIWPELVRDLDQRLLETSDSKLLTRFKLLTRYRDTGRLMPSSVAQEIDDWRTLLSRCGPLCPPWNDKIQWIRDWGKLLPVPNPLNLCLLLALVVPFGTGLVAGWIAADEAPLEQREPGNP